MAGSPQSEEAAGPQSEERLQKTLARVGLGSRRACEILIADGRVRVNGETASLGQKVDPDRDSVEVDGVLIAVRPDLVCYLLNKPAGVVTTASDPEGRPTVIDLVPAEPRVFSGRSPRLRHRRPAHRHQRRRSRTADLPPLFRGGKGVLGGGDRGAVARSAQTASPGCGARRRDLLRPPASVCWAPES